PYPTPRVGQLDASLLDAELVDTLNKQLLSAFDGFMPTIKTHYSTELLVALKLLLFKLTIWDHGTTYGGLLQNVTLTNSKGQPATKAQRGLYGMISILGGYVWQKCEDTMYRDGWEDEPRGSWRSRVAEVLKTANKLWKVATALSFALFLFSGRYSTLVLRILRLRFTPGRVVSRQTSFEFQNRQLVWSVITEFLVFILPMLHIPRLRRRIERLFNKQTSGELDFLPLKVCAICYKDSDVAADITNPYEASPCGHIYCYVCLQTKLSIEQGDGWACLRCGEIIKSGKPWTDV
ncbi:hypothetical protein CANCADRAFT_17054, partial [Tortispora caseinolytica NRRL Y-17796]